MPIAPEQRNFYPIDWRELSRLIRFGRAKAACERCGRPHGREIVHLGDGTGTWWDDERGCWRDGEGRRRRSLAPPAALEARQPALAGLGLEAGLELGPVRGPAPALLVTRVVLASCHLDHDPSNNRPRNLAALC